MSYVNAFIAASEDCPAAGEIPPRRAESPTAAEVQYAMLVGEPYQHTHDDVLFASSSLGRQVGASQPEARASFFAKPQACLRASGLSKRYGWGIHFDAEGRAAAYPVGSEAYVKLAADPTLTQTKGMRSKRAVT